MDEEKKKQVYARRLIKSTQLHHALTKFKALYLEQGQAKELVIPYVLLCAAFLEAKLNDSLYESAKDYGEDFANALMSASLPNKLKILVPTLTKGQYEINKSHFVYQRLISLVRTRNTIAHAKSELEEITVGEEDLVERIVMFGGISKVPKQFLYSDDDITLGASKDFSPIEYHEALSKLDKWFFLRCPDRLSKVEMVTARPKEQWQEIHSTFSKTL